MLDWKETGAPVAQVPQTEGIGTKLMQALAKRSSIQIERAFEPDGFRCRIRLVLGAPADRVASFPSAAATGGP